MVKQVVPVVDRVIALLEKPSMRLTKKEISKSLHVSVREVEAALKEVRERRKDLSKGRMDKTYYLSNIPTAYSLSTDLSARFENDDQFGWVSDTHLGSNAERLDILERAYDKFASEGIKTVIHTGDVSDGFMTYRTHHINVKVYGDLPQAKYVVDKYPKRAGMKTYYISGNHDLDSYGKTGNDRASLFANGFTYEGRNVKGREDMVYLGQYAHRILLPEEVSVDLLHPLGGSSYAKTYRHQKISEEMLPNNRPHVHLNGHWHTFIGVYLQGTWFYGASGMQDETEFFKRAGYARSMGFQICRFSIRDGNLHEFHARYFPTSERL